MEPSSFVEPKPKYPKPYYDDPYVTEMFGELYFKENFTNPVTMTELFGDFPKPSKPPQPAAADSCMAELFGEFLFFENTPSVSMTDLLGSFPNRSLQPRVQETENHEREEEKKEEEEEVAAKDIIPMVVEKKEMEGKANGCSTFINPNPPLVIGGKVYPPLLSTLRMVNGKVVPRALADKILGSSTSEEANGNQDANSTDKHLCE